MAAGRSARCCLPLSGLESLLTLVPARAACAVQTWPSLAATSFASRTSRTATPSALAIVLQKSWGKERTFPTVLPKRVHEKRPSSGEPRSTWHACPLHNLPKCPWNCQLHAPLEQICLVARPAPWLHEYSPLTPIVRGQLNFFLAPAWWPFFTHSFCSTM